MINVMIVDDHALVRLGISKLLESFDGINVIAEAENGEQALKLAKELKPDVVLLDMKMPGIDGLEVTRRLKHQPSNIRIVVLSAFTHQPFPSRVLQAGASGFLTKECGPDEMKEAICRVYQGERYLSASIAQEIALNSISEVDDSKSPFDQLSERELQVTLMITRGMNVSEISQQLCLSSKTVNGYRYRLFAKLGVKNDVELTYLAIKHGLVTHFISGDKISTQGSDI